MNKSQIEGRLNTGAIVGKAISYILRNILWISLLTFIYLFNGLLLGLAVDLPAEGTLASFIYHSSTIVLSWLSWTLINGIIPVHLEGQMSGKATTKFEALKKVARKLPHLFILHMGICIAIAIGFFCLIIPGIIIACATLCALPALMIEDLNPFMALERSWTLTEKNRFRIFCYLLLGFVISTCIYAGLFALNLSYGTPTTIRFFTIFLPATVFFPLFPAISTLLFIDLRVRKQENLAKEQSNFSSQEIAMRGA